jgi:hypothetical protein
MAIKRKVGGGRALNFTNAEEKAQAAIIAVEHGTVSSKVYSEHESVLYVNGKQFQELEKARKKGIIHYEEYNSSNKYNNF